MASFRDRFLTPRVARAITSPSAIVATGGGAAVGILAFSNPIGAVALGLGAFAVRVLAAVPRNERHPGVDLRSLEGKWRKLIEEILDARRRFDKAVTSARPGPLRDRLGDLGDRLDTAVEEGWRTASAGQSLTDARAQIDGGRIHAELAAEERAVHTDSSEERIAAIRSQLASAERLDRTIAESYDRLRLLDARIDETVARAIELSVTMDDDAALSGLGHEVDSIVGDMEALRQAVEETRSTSPTMPAQEPNAQEPPPFPRTQGGAE